MGIGGYQPLYGKGGMSCGSLESEGNLVNMDVENSLIHLDEP
jgi:hypothetical protein